MLVPIKVAPMAGLFCLCLTLLPLNAMGSSSVLEFKECWGMLGQKTYAPEEAYVYFRQAIAGIDQGLMGLSIPSPINFYVRHDKDSFSRAYTMLDEHQNTISLKGHDPWHFFHELGHIIFDHNLYFLSDGELARSAREFRERKGHLSQKHDSIRQKMKLKPSEDLKREFLASEAALLDLQSEFKRVLGISKKHFTLRYAELFSDTLSYALTGDPSSPDKDVLGALTSDFGPSTAGKLQHARDFRMSLTLEEWPDIHPFNEEHFYFAPVRSFIGTLLKDKTFSERLAFVKVVYKAILIDLERSSSQLSCQGYYCDTRDLAKANRDLIQEIQKHYSVLLAESKV